MKKRAISITLFFVTLFTITAQDINFGAKSALNIASIKLHDKNYNATPHIGSDIVGIVNYEIKEKLTAQLEVNYSMGGNIWNYNNSNTTGNLKTSLITIPMLAQYELLKNLSAEAGIQYNFLHSIKQKIDGMEDGFKDVSKLHKSSSFAFVVGGLCQLDFILPGLEAGIRYTKDLSKRNYVFLDEGKPKRNIFQLNFVYTLSN